MVNRKHRVELNNANIHYVSVIHKTDSPWMNDNVNQETEGNTKNNTEQLINNSRLTLRYFTCVRYIWSTILQRHYVLISTNFKTKITSGAA